MAPQDWQSPGLAGGTHGAAAEPAAAFEMRPLSTGEVLDRTFAVYRSRFWLFAGLAAISGGFQVILNALQLLAHHLLLVHSGLQSAKMESQVSALLLLLLMLPVTAVVYAASVFALCEVYLGRAITAREALRSTARQWMRYLGIALWWGWSAAWAFALLAIPAFVIVLGLKRRALLWLAGVLFFLAFTGGSVYGVIAYIRNSLAIPAAVMEGSGVRASMRRSKTLAAGTKGRIFVVMLIVVALYMVALTIDSPMLFVIGRAPFQEHIAAQAVILLVGFVTNTLVSPVALIGLSLVYFDQRVRREGFDLLMLLGPDTMTSAGSAPAPAPPEFVPAGVSPPMDTRLPALNPAARRWRPLRTMRPSSKQLHDMAARALLPAFALLLLACPAQARVAETRPVSPAQFRADVTRLQALVAACAQAAPACNPAQVGPDEQVGDTTHGGFAMHWQWLREALDDARTSKGDRTPALNDATAQLGEIAEEFDSATDPAARRSFGPARAAANAILARPEFQAADAPTWWDRQKAKLWQWLAQFFDGVGRLGSAAPWLGRLLEWLLFTGAAVGLLFFLLRNLARQRLRVALGAGAIQATAWAREPDDWSQRAEAHAAAGQWRQAVHCLYWAAIVLLEARRAWRHNPARTPREYARLLRAGSAQHQALRGLTQIFERVWYGLREADAEQYARARGLYEQLATGAETASSTAIVAVAAGNA